MGIREGEIDYTLKRSFKYSKAGQTVEARVILLREPGMEHSSGYYKLTEFVSQSQIKSAAIAKDLKLNSDTDINDIGEQSASLHNQVDELENENAAMEEMISVALKLSGIDIAQFVKTFQKIAVKVGAAKPIALVDGDQTVPLTNNLWNKLHVDDAFEMAVRWCSFFVTAVDIVPKNKSEAPPESLTPVQEV